MKKAALHNLGCRVNSYETECMTQMLAEAGYEIVPFSEKADVYVVNTCSVTQIADKKSRQMLRRCRSLSKDAVVVATGCYVQTGLQHIIDECDVDIIIGNNEKDTLIKRLKEFEENKSRIVSPSDLEGTAPYDELFLSDTSEHTRAFMKVQDGCDQFCSYCIIPYARGRVRSRSIASSVKEAEHLTGLGFKEIVLTGIHMGSFGKDSGEKLIDLIKAVANVEGVERLRFGSLEPRVMSEEFVKELSDIPEICPHFHLSLQSGSDSVLKRMNRHYTTEEYKASCDIIRKYFDHPAITTDVIAGFPGETEEEFGDCLAFVEEIGFYHMHVFPYSVRQGTRAAKMPDQIRKEIKEKRAAQLIALSDKMSADYEAGMEGRQVSVLFEEEKDGYLTGFTREYVRVYSKGPSSDIGEIKSGTLKMTGERTLEM